MSSRAVPEHPSWLVRVISLIPSDPADRQAGSDYFCYYFQLVSLSYGLEQATTAATRDGLPQGLGVSFPTHRGDLSRTSRGLGLVSLRLGGDLWIVFRQEPVEALEQEPVEASEHESVAWFAQGPAV